MVDGIDVFDKRFETILVGASLEKLCTGATWSEGPLWLSEEDAVIWSDIPNNRILRWSAVEGMTIWQDDVEFTNGRYRHPEGYIVHCSHGRRAIERSGLSGNLENVVNHYQGRRLNSPNDVVVKSDGTIWFTDPPYGILSNDEGHKADSELGGNYVFRFDPKTKSLDIVTDFVEEPNGLAFSVDESILYVSDTSAALREDGSGNHHIVAFDVVGNRTLAKPRIFAEVSPGLSDGFRLDQQGWIYTSSEDSIQVYDENGQLLGKIYVPEMISNCTFGGVDRDELYITASTSLYRIKLNTKGVQNP